VARVGAYRSHWIARLRNLLPMNEGSNPPGGAPEAAGGQGSEAPPSGADTGGDGPAAADAASSGSPAGPSLADAKGSPDALDRAAGAAQPLFTPPPAGFDAKKKRAAVIQLIIALAFIVIIFGWLLPQVIDYEEIFNAIGELEAWQFVVLFIAGVIVWLPEGWLYSLLVPTLKWRQGVAAWVASTGVGTTIPAMDLVVRYGMYRSWGAPPERAMLGIFLSGIFDNIVKFSLPVISVIALIAFGVVDLPGWILVVALIAGLIVAGTLVVVIGVSRSVRFAEWLGRTGESFANWLLRLLKREPMQGTADRIVGVRDAAISTVSSVWGRAFLASAMGKLWTYVILMIALRFAEIPPDVISATQAFVVWTLVLLVQSIPLTPGGVGFVEAAYIAMFSAIAGPEYATQIGVAVALYRAAQWALPIPVGWMVVGWWRIEIKRGKLPDPFRGQAVKTQLS